MIDQDTSCVVSRVERMHQLILRQPVNLDSAELVRPVASVLMSRLQPCHSLALLGYRPHPSSYFLPHRRDSRMQSLCLPSTCVMSVCSVQTQRVVYVNEWPYLNESG